MSEQLFLVDRPEHAQILSLPGARVLSSDDQILAAYQRRPRRCVWIAPHAGCLTQLRAISVVRRDAGRSCGLLLLERVRAERRAWLRERFEPVVEPGDGIELLDRAELLEVMASPRREDLLIGGAVDTDDRVVVLYRGNLRSVVVPLAWFVGSASAPAADPYHFSITDFGQTVRLGRFDASVDAILYEFDHEYRRRAKARQLESDDTLGGSIRRLRLQKALGQDAFPGISAKEIGRIERNEVRHPHRDTLARIARRLEVEIDDLATF